MAFDPLSGSPGPHSSTERTTGSGPGDGGPITPGGAHPVLPFAFLVLFVHGPEGSRMPTGNIGWAGMQSKYVSRAGGKLAAALEHFGVDVKGKICLDVGAATGGFTDCLLQHGARKVYSVETGYGVLDWKLRQDPRVVVLERTNILYAVPISEKVDMAVVDTSWTRLKLSLPAASRFVKPQGVILALVKPQYEATRTKKGVVLDADVELVVERVRQELKELGFEVSEKMKSLITGEGGNREFWVEITK